MATKADLDAILKNLREMPTTKNLVRGQRHKGNAPDLDSVKGGGEEYYFNLSPNEKWQGASCQLCLCLRGKQAGYFSLGVSFAKLAPTGRYREAFADQFITVMEQLTQNRAQFVHNSNRRNPR